MPFEKLKRKLPWRLGVLVGGLAILLCVLGSWAGSRHGWPGVFVAAFAVGICGLGAILALLATVILYEAGKGPLGVLIGICLRTGFPALAALFMALVLVPRWPNVGVLEWMLGAYLAVLAIETPLALPDWPWDRDDPESPVS